MKPTVHLDSARGAEWEAILGTREIPVQSPVPVLCTLPGCAIPQMGYALDLAALSPDQKERLAASIAEKYRVHISDAWAKMLISGIAIDARGGCSVSFAPELLPAVIERLEAADRARGRRRAA